MMLVNTFPASLLLAALLSQLSAKSVTAFSATSPSRSLFHFHQTSSSSTRLFISTIYSDFSEVSPRLPLSEDAQDLQDLQDFAAPTSLEIATLRSMDLPKHGPSAEQMETTEAMMSIEMMLGRGAMLLAVVLAATEVTTGRSLPEQLSVLFS